MTKDAARRRAASSHAQRIEARDRTNEVARSTIEEERRLRDAKTVRLRAARMQAKEPFNAI
jgi:hypothetical protein